MAFFNDDNYLICPDTHAPEEHELALKFIINCIRIFRIPPSNIYHTGDEVDVYFMNMYGKDPDAEFTDRQELSATREKIALWGKHIPQMKLCYSNHVSRIWRKAAISGITSEIIKPYREIINAPKGWEWQDHWTVNASKMKFMIMHGEGYSGAAGHIQAAFTMGMSTAIGHLHSRAGVNWIETRGQKIWAANCGSLINDASKVFSYAKHAKFRPSLGCVVVLDGGLTPIFVPLR